MPRVVCAIGCGTFQDPKLRPLPGAGHDAQIMFSILTEPSLGAANEDAPSMLVLDPTQDEILSHLENFFNGAGLIGADAIVYFSGHAVALSTGGWGFFCQDSSTDSAAISTLSFRELEASWHGSGVQRCMFIIDTCYARTAAPAEYISKRSSPMSAESPRASEEGLVLIWSSTETTESFEDGQQSIFSRLFQKGIEGGFGAPPFRRTVRPSEAVQWMQFEAKAERVADFIKVSSSELGVTDSLFLSKNPRYDAKATARTDPQVLLRLETQHTTVQRMQMLCSIADAYREQRPRLEPRRSTLSTSLSPYLRFDPVSNTEICLIPTTRRAVIVAELLRWPKLFLITVPLVVIAGYYRGRSGLLCAYGVMLLVSAIRIVMRRHEWRDPLKHFLLVTQDGFFQHNGDQSTALLWSCVSYISDHLGFSAEVVLRKDCEPEGTLNVQKGKVVFPLTSAYGSTTLDSSLAWGKHYSRDRWQWETFANRETSVRQQQSEAAVHLLVGLSSYEHLQNLPGSEDLKVAKAAFDADSVIPLLDPSLPEFRTQLDDAFSKAAGGTLVLYFSGHAVIKGRELYLMTRESDPAHLYSGFPLHKLPDLQQERNVSDVIVILDCCFSGAGGPALDISLRDVRSRLERMRRGVQGRLWLLAGSREDQQAWATESASLFTTALFSAANELSESDGTLQMSEWYEATANRMRFGQQPVFFSFDEPTRRVRLGAIARHLTKRARELQDAARAHVAEQESRLSTIVNAIEPKLRGVESKRYQLANNTGSVFRSKHKWKSAGKVRTAIGHFAAGLIAAGGLAILVFLVGVAVTMSVLGRIPEFVGWFGTIGVTLIIVSVFLFFVGSPNADEHLYVVIAHDGIICKRRESTSIIPADNIVDTYYAGEVTTVDTTTIMSDGIGVKLRNGSKIKLFEEITHPRNVKEWPAEIEELKSIVTQAVAEFANRTKQFDNDLAQGTISAQHVELKETGTV